MNESDILDYDGEQTRLDMAGFGLRLIAAIIDSFIVGFVFYAVIIGFGFLTISQASPDDSAAPFVFGVLMMYIVLFPLFIILYHAGFESASYQGSIGKMAMSIKVVNEHGDRISFAQALGRNAGKIISAIILYIGFLMAIWTENKQALHDIMANTLVVRK